MKKQLFRFGQHCFQSVGMSVQLFFASVLLLQTPILQSGDAYTVPIGKARERPSEIDRKTLQKPENITEQLRWEVVEQEPRIEPIFGQSCTLLNSMEPAKEHKILMYAGFMNNTRNTNDMRAFSIETRKWEGIEQHSRTSIPWARNAASTVLYTDQLSGAQTLLVFGGSQMDAEALGDTWEFDLQQRLWTEYTAGIGQGPSRRYAASLILRSEAHTAVLFGGAFWREKIYHNDLWSYSFTFHNWTELLALGDSPSPRFGHCAAYSNRYMYVYGGGNEAYSSFQIVWAYSFDQQRWAQVLQLPPAGRSWAQSVVLHGYWYIVGGDRNGTDFIDVLRWPLDPVSGRGPWEVLDIAGPYPLGRLDHCVTVDGKNLYMIGGYSYERSGADNDMWMLNLTDALSASMPILNPVPSQNTLL